MKSSKKELKKREKQKFTELIESNKLRFYKTAKAILKNDDDVYDTLQEALISMYENYGQLKKEEYFSTWATTIIINKCYDLLRKNKKDIVSIDDEFENNIKLAQYDIYSVDEYGIMEAISKMKEDFRLIIILYYYDEYSIKEIAQILEIPEGTAKSRLFKARENLKTNLGKEGK